MEFLEREDLLEDMIKLLCDEGKEKYLGREKVKGRRYGDEGREIWDRDVYIERNMKREREIMGLVWSFAGVEADNCMGESSGRFWLAFFSLLLLSHTYIIFNLTTLH